ncbi:uncharacterized protein ACA1_192110 [Acanthamoeba castellanii str. Neff]|uniref:Uncharacterized protein n=1 Tax=Acanthamoeba castellanii (strain ATCC 30010 / Neff) TaxID=1257118 RepID=L8GQS2_ACACF|nr:uncharacterized protein ACA1_192110 [Acanthamoeba castellanii str. Neff]ELR14481.1 hypothetical protein ACA1_192110 [Acanthamoeba castellanii str. Neff]
MDNYQLMKVVELELRKQQKRIRRKQREEERERRKMRRASRDLGNKQIYRREPSLPTSNSLTPSSSAGGLPPLSFVGLRRPSGPGGDSEWSGSEDAQSHFMIQRDIIPSPTTSECNFMSDDEFRGEFRFGDEDFAEEDDDGDEEEWERSDDDDDLGTDEETDEEDYYEEEDDDEGTPRHSPLQYKAGGEGILLRLSATRESPTGLLRPGDSPRGGAITMQQSDDAHMAKWRKWEQKQRAHGTHAAGSSDDRSAGSEEEAESELRARETMMSTLKATIEGRRLKGAPGSENHHHHHHHHHPQHQHQQGGHIERVKSGVDHDRVDAARVVRRTRSASEKNELANHLNSNNQNNGSNGGSLHAASDDVPQIRVSGDWGVQWLRREGSMDDYDDDEDDRVMLVPEFEEDGVADGGKIFFIPFESGSGDVPLPALSESQVKRFIGHALKAVQRTEDSERASDRGAAKEEEEEEEVKEEPRDGGEVERSTSTDDDDDENADPHDHDPPPPLPAPQPNPETETGTADESQDGELRPGTSVDVEPANTNGGEAQAEQASTSPGSCAEAPAEHEQEDDDEEEAKSTSSVTPEHHQQPQQPELQQPRSEESDETTNTEGRRSPPTPVDGLASVTAGPSGQPPQPLPEPQPVVHVGIVAVPHHHVDPAALHNHTTTTTNSNTTKGIDEPWTTTTEQAATATIDDKLAGHRQSRHEAPTATATTTTTTTTTQTREQRRREKGKEKIDDDELKGESGGGHHDHSSVSAAAAAAGGNVRRATVLPRPTAPAASATTGVDGGAARKDWVWDREHRDASPREGSHAHLRGSGGSSGTRSPREGATKRSPLLGRDDPQVAVAATSCLSCTLS